MDFSLVVFGEWEEVKKAMSKKTTIHHDEKLRSF